MTTRETGPRRSRQWAAHRIVLHDEPHEALRQVAFAARMTQSDALWRLLQQARRDGESWYDLGERLRGT